MNIINYVLETTDDLIAIVGAVGALASLIAALTPTPADDKWTGKAYKIIDWLALNVGKAKNKPGE